MLRYKNFMRDYPEGRLSKNEFHERFFPSGDASQFAEHLFDVLDTDHNGEIDFKEFIYPLSLMSRGDSDEKIKCAYPSFPLHLPAGAQPSAMTAVIMTSGAASLILTHLCSL